jgi:copper chaperone CopZ
METTELKVDGMTCGSCVASVKKALARVPGVKDVQVDLRSGIARVTADHATQQVPAMVAALSDAGYGAAGAATTTIAKPAARAGSCRGSTPKQGGGCCCN